MGTRPATLLALDVGTTEARATVRSIDGRVLARGHHRHALAFPAGDRVEIDPWELVRSMTAALQAVREHAADVSAVAIAAELGTVFVDAELTPLGNALCWPDKRSWREAGWIAAEVGRDSVYATTGRVVDPELPAAKYLWLKRNEPARARQARWLLSIKDFLVSALCGRAVTDETHASYSMLFDVRRRRWAVDLAFSVGVDPGLLPPVHPAQSLAGTVTAQAASRTGLRQGTPVAVGGPDGTVGTVGAGLVRAGVTTDLIGTADVVFHGTDEPVFDAAHRAVVNAHAVPGMWAVGGPTGTTGGTVAKVASLLGLDEDDRGFAALDELAASVAAGSSGLAFMTSLAGDRFPAWDPNAAGVVFGLRLDHGRGHLARAVLEGAAYTLRGALEVYGELGLSVGTVRVAGGGSRSPTWCQLRADVCGVPLVTVNVSEATSLGATMLAAVCVGLAPDLAGLSDSLVGVGVPVVPVPEEALTYGALYADYKRLRAELAGGLSFWNGRRRQPEGLARGDAAGSPMEHDERASR